MSYSTKVPCPDQDQAFAKHPAAAKKTHKAVSHPHPRPKPKVQPVAAVHDASETATPIKKVVHIKRKPKPKPSFAPLVLAANDAHINRLPTAAVLPLVSHPVDPPVLCEAVHRGDAPPPTPVSNPGAAVAPPAPDVPFLSTESAGPSAPGSEASVSKNPFSEPFAPGPFGGGGGPPGAIGNQSLTPPEGGTTPPPTDTAPVSTIPEPSDWALMMLGLGAVGAGLRSRRLRSKANRAT